MRILVIRIGALGDTLITTPLIRYLKNQDNEIYYLGSESAEQILENNPNVDKFILHKKNSVESDKLIEYFESIKKEHQCDTVIDLCESIEVRLALTDNYPQWNWTKKERRDYCDINYYEHCFTHAGIDARFDFMGQFYVPEMFFTDEEEDSIAKVRSELLGKAVIMWGLSGSGRQKTYPYVPYIVNDILRDFKDVVFILVGGETCKVLECAFPKHHRILKKCGDFNFRQSALMAKYADLVVSPDTGFLHAAGCWDTKKIGLLTHTTIENITKHFKNDFSIESMAPCAPCFRLIDNAELQCPIEPVSTACLCMSKDSMRPEVVYERIVNVIRGCQVSCV